MQKFLLIISPPPPTSTLRISGNFYFYHQCEKTENLYIGQEDAKKVLW